MLAVVWWWWGVPGRTSTSRTKCFIPTDAFWWYIYVNLLGYLHVETL